MRTCYIHIGAPKTGSTSIQSFCCANNKELKRRGILYPMGTVHGFGHHDLAFLLGGGYPNWAIPQDRSLSDLLQDLTVEVTEYEGDILISSEDFYIYTPPHGLLEALESIGITNRFKPVIIVYLRRQDDAHESWYNQTIKAQGYAHTIEDCLNLFYDMWDYHTQLKRWDDAFGKDNIKVRIYEGSSNGEMDVRKDLLEILNIDPEHFHFTETVVNTRINRDILEFQRIINNLPMSPSQKRQYHKQLIELSAKSQFNGLFSDGPILSCQQRSEILERYSDSNQDVAERYLNRKILFKPKPRLECEEKYSPYDGLSIEKIIYIFGWILLNMNASDRAESNGG